MIANDDVLALALEAADRFGLFVPEPVTASWLDRPSWLKARNVGIGSSESWKLFSPDPDDRMDLYLEKTGQKTRSDEDNADMERGRLFEPVAAMKYAEKTGRELVALPLIRLAAEPLLFTDVDRLILPNTGQGAYRTRRPGSWEGKVPRWHVLSSYRRHGLPDRIIWQVQHHLAVTGFDFCSITIFNADSLVLIEWDIPRDETMVRQLRDEIPRFWTEHVEPCIPPETDEIPVDGMAIARVPGSVKKRKGKRWLEAAALFREADPLYREAESLRDEAKARLRKLVRDFGSYEGGGIAASLNPTEGRLQAEATLNAIADLWPLDSREFKKLAKAGELRGPDGEKLGPGKVAKLVSTMGLNVYGLKRYGKPGERFGVRILREEIER